MINIFDYKEWDQFDLCYAIDFFFISFEDKKLLKFTFYII